jgi:hypothetical protein
MNRIKVAFRYFYEGFEPYHFMSRFSFLNDLVDVVPEAEAQLIIFSVWHGSADFLPSEADRAAGRFHAMPRIERLPGKTYLFWSGENIIPNMDWCDYAISHVYSDNPRHLRLPYWIMALHGYGVGLERIRYFNAEIGTEETPARSCNFLYSHSVPFRENFVRELSAFIDIVCPGLSLNNTDEKISSNFFDKLRFVGQFKFTIAFENSSDPGYTTEKIIDPLLAGSVPIYWGNPRVLEEFDRGCLILADDFPDISELGLFLKRLVSDPEAYEAIRRHNRFAGDQVPLVAEDAYTRSFFDAVLGAAQTASAPSND